MAIPVTESMSAAATLPLVSSGLPQTSASLNPALGAGATMQLGDLHAMQQPMRSTGNTSDATAGSDKETNGKAEVRRARR